MSLFSEAVSLLNRDKIRNYCVLELLRQSGKHEIFIHHESVMIRLKDDDTRFTMISSVNVDEGRALALRLGNDDLNLYHTGEYPGDIMIGGRQVRIFSDCVQMYLPDDARPDADLTGVTPLDPGMASYIHERYNYRHYVSKDYIESRIRVGPAFCIMDKGWPVGWVMTHEEGTMGILHVLPEYRGRGYAYKLNVAIINSLRAANKPCIVHIVKGNSASLATASKLGFKFSCDVQWIHLSR